MPKWVYPLAFVFLLFFIFNDSAGAGDQANAFAGFVGRFLSAIGDFLNGLFGETGTTGGDSLSNS